MVKKEKEEKLITSSFTKKPWHSDNTKHHAEEQHKVRYHEYSKLSGEEKRTIFRKLKLQDLLQ